ncbi:MAG: hypothetical protein QXP31_11530 [Pyrobaculum sp.]
MRWLFLVLVLALGALGLETSHFVVTPNDTTLAGYLEDAYSYYTSKGLAPAPPCQGQKYPVYVDSSSQYDAYTQLGGECVVKLVFKPGYTRRLVFHEVGHVFLEKYDSSQDYFWGDEAAPEAMASVATGVYYFPAMYFSEKLYTVNPFSLGEDRVYDWYKYSAAIAWYLENSSWEWVLRAFTSRSGAARLYVYFLLALAKGVSLGGVRYEPVWQEVTVTPGVTYLYPDLPGYTAAYYKLSFPQAGGVLRISVDSPNVVSNLVLNRDVALSNDTLLLAVVNNSSNTAGLKISIYYSTLRVSLVDGRYENGAVYLKLYVDQGGRVSGVVKINGTDVPFVDGIGYFNFTGGLRPYVLRVEYGGYTAYLYLNLTQPRLILSPAVLYLGAGGYGAVNVTLVNPNPISVSCLLNGSGRGVVFTPIRVSAPPNATSVYQLGFRALGNASGLATVNCGEWAASLRLSGVGYSLLYDLDKESGNLTAVFGNDVRTYAVGRLPATVSLYYGGYVAGVVKIDAPIVKAAALSPKLVGGLIQYTLSVEVAGPPWARFLGIVAVDGIIRGVYNGGVLNLTLSLRPGERRDVLISVGRLSTTLRVEAPTVQTSVVPLGAIVEGGVASILVEIRHNVETLGAVPVEFGGAGFLDSARIGQNLVVVRYRYNETVNVVYSALGDVKAVKVVLPRPSFQISLVEGVVSPSEFRGVFNITVYVCKPSVDSKYRLEVGGRLLVVSTRVGTCGANYTLAEWRSGYAQRVTVSFNTSLGPVSYALSLPKPRVDAQLVKWVVEGDAERAFVRLFVSTPPNYTYVVLGREARGRAVLNVSVDVVDGVAAVDYGFDAVRLRRPALYMSADPLVAEAGVGALLRLRVRVPQGLYVNSRLATSMGMGIDVRLEPGDYVVNLTVLGNSPGVYNVSLRLGPYVNYTKVVFYEVRNLSLSAPSLLPVGVPARINVTGLVTPRVPARVVVEVGGCGNVREVARLNSTLIVSLNRTCVAAVRAYTNRTSTGTVVKWASLSASFNFTELGVLRGLPIFPQRGIYVRAMLGDVPVAGRVVLVGDFDRLGLVNFTAYVEYMGVVNSTSFVGFAVPADSYKAALKTTELLPLDARPFFQYLVERAVATGQWDVVDKISKLYADPPTPFTIAARYLVERSLAAGKEPNTDFVLVLQKVEPAVLGVLGGLLLATVRRLV